MSYTTTNWFNFQDSQLGAGTTYANKTLTNQVVDRKYHKQVQKKLFFTRNGMIGADTYGEGQPHGVYETAPGFPVIRKTDLSVVSGDTIKIGMRKNLTTTVNTGVVATTQLVDSESTFDFYSCKVQVEQWRNGVATWGGSNAQRNPYESFEEMEINLCSDWAAQMEDTGILYALHYRYAPHMFRIAGHSDLAPSANKNTLFGNDVTLDTTRTIANLQGGGADNLKAQTFELADAYLRQSDIEPVMVNGQAYWVSLISPKAWSILLRDTDFRNAFQYARERGESNPLFNNAEAIVYSNCVIFRYDKIRTILGGYRPGGLTTANGTTGGDITEAVYTGIGGGVASTDLHMSYFLGANAVALAEGQFRMANRIRSENDYQNIIGRAIDSIWGSTRMDFADETPTVQANQSSLCIVNTVIA